MRSQQRWLLSYADMVTLLFACFAALYASTVLPAGQPAPAPAPGAAPTEDRTPLIEALDAALARAGLGGALVRGESRGVVVSLPEAGTFAPGQADLSQAARRAIRELATVLEATAGEIRIEGHTDDTPIATSRFASNWELSAARATEVIRFLLAQTTLAPGRLAAAGYGEFRPVVPNRDAAGRARNRRVDIVVVP